MAELKVIKKHTHTLTPGLVGILLKVIERVKETNRNLVHIQKDLKLTNSEFCNFQKLRYFGLMAKYVLKDVNYPGYWVITRWGGAFLRNEKGILNKVITINNEVVERLGEERKISSYYGNYPEEYWQQEFGSVNINQPSLL